MLPAILFALGLAFSSVTAFADAPMTKISVEVKDLKDRPVERASVIVRFVEGRSLVKFGKRIQTRWELRTNQNGVAKVPSIPQGKISVQVIAKNYQTFGEIIDVSEEEKTIAVKLNPPQPQYSAH